MKRTSPSQGVALVITLAMIAMMTFLVVAFLSRSLTNFQSENASTGNSRADLLARSACQIVVSDFKSEIIAGSTASGTGAQQTIYTPKNAAVSVPTVARYVSLPTYDATFNNVVKQSTGAFYDLTKPTYNFNQSVKPIVQSVTDYTTAELSANGRSVVKERWDNPSVLAPSGPMLLAGDITYGRFYTNTFLPHWVMMTRQGVPTVQSGATIPSAWKDYTPSTTSDAAIGRFAYNIYNVSGLLDANAVGYEENSTSTALTTAVGQKGTQGLAKISLLPGMGTGTTDQMANAVKFVKAWRNAASGGSVNDYLAYLGFTRSDANNPSTSLITNPFFMAGPKSGFLMPAATTTGSDNRVLGRQDLIRLAVKTTIPSGTIPAYGLTAKTLAYMTHFSREVNSPSWSPTQNASTMGGNDGSGTPVPYAYLTNKDDPNAANRFFSNVRVAPDATWRRLTGELAVPGEPLIKYRFPLSWLALLEDANPSTPAWDLTPEAIAIVTALDARNIANGGTGLTGANVNQKAAYLVLKAFGLVWDPSDTTAHVPTYPANLGPHWNYYGNATSANPGLPVATRIALLGDSATAPPITIPVTPAPVCRDKREPNFFELLKAGILSGSLGNASDYESMCLNVADDSFSDYQVMQIGANIIDQADADSYPTKIIFGYRFDNPPAIKNARTPVYTAGSNKPPQTTEAKLICGVEDLPYIYTFLSTPYRIPVGQSDLNQDLPSPDPNPPYAKVQNAKQDMLDCWLQFVMWKPHQPPVTAPATTMKFRIALNGSFIFLYYFKDNVTFHNVDFGSSAVGTTAPVLTSATVNFDDSPDFRAPTVLGGMGSTTLHNFTVAQTPAPTQGTVPLPRGMWMGEMYRPEKDPSDTNYANAPAVIHTEFRAKEDVKVELQYQDAGGGWRTYQKYDRFAAGTGSSTYGQRSLYGYADDIGTLRSVIGPSSADWGTPPYYRRLDVSTLAISAIDPRSHRFGLLALYRDLGGSGGTPSLGPDGNWNTYLKLGWDPKGSTPYYMCFGPGSTDLVNPRYYPNWTGGPSDNPWQSHPNDHPILDPTNFWPNNISVASGSFYKDMDGIQRRGDGDSGNSVRPMQLNGLAANTTDLGRVLNRPFRSVGELGYVFRDEPYKSLNLFTDKSADSALLDLFSVNEQPAIVGGKVNLNTKNPEVLQALIVAAAREEMPTTNVINTADALTIATALYNNTKDTTGAVNTGPIMNPSEIANRLAKILPISSGDSNTTIKARREVVGRALASSGQTRTWNFLVDIIAQSGRYGPNATSPAQFIVEGERRYWLHVAIDRYTGQVIDQQLEPVME